jgi:hypothetical protein
MSSVEGIFIWKYQEAAQPLLYSVTEDEERTMVLSIVFLLYKQSC